MPGSGRAALRLVENLSIAPRGIVPHNGDLIGLHRLRSRRGGLAGIDCRDPTRPREGLWQIFRFDFLGSCFSWLPSGLVGQHVLTSRRPGHETFLE